MVQAKNLVKTDFVKIDINETVTQFLGKLRQKKQTFAVVYDGKNYKGIVDRKFLLTSRIDASKMRLNNILKHASKRKTPFFVPKLTPKAEVEEICKMFATSAARALPVFEKEKLIGIVTARSVMRVIKPYYRGLQVTELASPKNLVTAQEKDETGKVVQLMHQKNVDRVPIVTPEGKILGVVTAYDIMKRFHRVPKTSQRMPAGTKHSDWADSGWEHGERQDMMKLPIGNIMTPYPMVCCAKVQSTVNEVLDLMINDDVNSVIITENDIPVGIITLQDIMQDYSLE